MESWKMDRFGAPPPRSNEILSLDSEAARAKCLRRIPTPELFAEFDRRGLVDWDPADLPDAALYRELGKRRQAKRKVHRGGPGRPPSPRCWCGRFTRNAARKRGHMCSPASHWIEDEE